MNVSTNCGEQIVAEFLGYTLLCAVLIVAILGVVFCGVLLIKAIRNEGRRR
jgi:isoprenylcysteine carboxyl methyltransferase (ICMT) family protein YpbQ